ncbi:hypothetical protein CLV46_0392 [Diaminobutyricimonas aerilata]|uniref:Uncharacterized protein n=2 Tax=Diaminobutyricimonas aerilata TaxID=1162967 RepID=A0A2M9CG21_9MICO|nr:hypothetical protein CLV46_0392 [Diaminobutyricimonas aerilata]
MLTPLSGEPEVVQDSADAADDIAQAIEDAARWLDRLAEPGRFTSKATDALRGDSTAVAVELREVTPRFTETADALSGYARELQDAQETAERAIAQADEAQGRVASLGSQVVTQGLEVAGEALTLDLDGAGDAAEELRGLTTRLDAAREDLADALALYRSAVDRKNDAAEAAARRIRLAADHYRDRLVDHLGSFFDGLGNLLDLIGDWIEGFFRGVLDVLLAIGDAIVDAFTALGAFLTGLVLLGIEGLLQLGLTIEQLLRTGLALALVGLGTLLFAWLALREANAPDPTVTPLDGPAGRHRSRTPGTEWSSLVLDNGELDNDGGETETHITVTQILDENGDPVLDENGKPVYRVLLPSTIDWGIGNYDQGALNDAGTDVILALYPEIQTAYEKAVREAMEQAGVPEGSSVMLSGWSLGGIMAGKLAADETFPYNVDTIFVSGAAPHLYDIPSDVLVIQQQHTGTDDGGLIGYVPDPVAPIDDLLTGRNDPPQGPNHIHIVAENPNGNVLSHNSTSYAQTAHDRLDDPSGLTPDQQASLHAAEDKYFSENESEQEFVATEQPGTRAGEPFPPPLPLPFGLPNPVPAW